MDDKTLSFAEQRDLAIQACMQLIPQVGGALSTLYFGHKQEIRLKRVESCYAELVQEVESLKDRIAPFEEHDRGALVAIIEEFNEKVEREQVGEKVEFLKSYFKNTLMHPVTKNNYDKRRFFLDVLSSMTMLECEVLGILSGKRGVRRVSSIRVGEADTFEIVGAVGRLKGYGFLQSCQTLNTMEKEVRVRDLYEMVHISDFGVEFREFCLKI